MPIESAPNLAVFADFENVAIGVRDAKYDHFSIDLCLERLLDKGKIVVKKAYADWERYKGSRRSMHEAAFELIEIPHVSYSGKNSADIRMVVDALDLCYTKQHVDVFVVISGDSDFSPLVSKLRENNKMVIGLGVKNSSSDLLIDNCDEFIYYDDLVRGKKRGGRKHSAPRKKDDRPVATSSSTATSSSASGSSAPGSSPPASAAAGGGNGAPASAAKAAEKPVEKASEKVGEADEAIEYVLETVESLFHDRGEDHVWGSMAKQTLKRKRPNFNETYYGYRTFGQLLEDAQKRGLLELQKDDKSGGWIILGFGPNA